MKQYLLSVYQPDGDPPPADVLLADIDPRSPGTSRGSAGGTARGCSRAGFTRRAPRRLSILVGRACRRPTGRTWRARSISAD